MRDAGSMEVDSGETPGLSCPELFECIDTCADTACEDACIERATTAALALATALAQCADENSCTTQECLDTLCRDELLACAGASPPADAGMPDGGSSTCSADDGMPELTGPLGGLSPSYAVGEPITVMLPVDTDTRRATVTIYDYDSSLMLGSVATEVGSSTATLTLPAGTPGAAPPGTYYLQVDLCSTSLCTSPLARNIYDRTGDETEYTATRRRTSMSPEMCATGIPITTFTID